MSQIGRISEIAKESKDYTQKKIAEQILRLVREFHKKSKYAHEATCEIQKQLSKITSDLEMGHYYCSPSTLGSQVQIMEKSSVVASYVSERNSLLEQINALTSILLGDEYEWQLLASDISDQVDMQSWDGMVTF
jgi:uncharacterized membrane protein YgaE (UPF0421/DUF939 family)